MSGQYGVAILGIFVADLAFRAGRLPRMGETVVGTGFKLGPGGKGSNQAVAARRVGADVRFISKLGRDAFGDIARATWAAEGIDASLVMTSETMPTGAAFIFVQDRTGENAIIVEVGAANDLKPDDLDGAEAAIAASRVFITQLEQPPEVAMRGLEIARRNGVVTVFNPAPAVPVDPAIFRLCDFVTPNESEAEAMTGMPVGSVDEARKAAERLVDLGAGTALITLGDKGVFVHGAAGSTLVPAFPVSPIIETTGAGDAFNGGFAAALAEGLPALEAVRFGCAVAGISVTRAGTAPSMPMRAEVEALLAKG